MKTVRIAVLTVMVLGSVSCSSYWQSPEEEEPPIDYVTIPARSFQADLKRAQQKQVTADARKVAKREAYEKLRQEYNQAGGDEKSALGVQLTAAQAEYIYAQSEHAAAKSESTLAKKAYVRKLIVDKHPELAITSTPVVESPAEVQLQREQEQIIGVGPDR